MKLTKEQTIGCLQLMLRGKSLEWKYGPVIQHAISFLEEHGPRFDLVLHIADGSRNTSFRSRRKVAVQALSDIVGIGSKEAEEKIDAGPVVLMTGPETDLEGERDKLEETYPDASFLIQPAPESQGS